MKDERKNQRDDVDTELDLIPQEVRDFIVGLRYHHPEIADEFQRLYLNAVWYAWNATNSLVKAIAEVQEYSEADPIIPKMIDDLYSNLGDGAEMERGDNEETATKIAESLWHQFLVLQDS